MTGLRAGAVRLAAALPGLETCKTERAAQIELGKLLAGGAVVP
jgi:hypothetical protein